MELPMKRIFGLFVLSSLFIISACSPQPAPTATPTPEPTATPTPKPFNGKLFFDMNGSGLQDESSFIYDKERLADPRQPLQPDLDKAIKAYIAAHPNLKNGDLVTIPEPGLSGYKVCIDQDCATTSSDGGFLIYNKTAGTTALLKINDPYADKPPLAMRYIIEWKGSLTIPAHEINGVQIPEQRINDTEEVPISNGKFFQMGIDTKIGIMQGFMTLPVSSSTQFYLWSFVDLDYRLGFLKDYKNQNTMSVNYDIPASSPKAKEGVRDQHQGIDYNMDIGNFLLSMCNSNVFQIEDEYHYVRFVKNFTAEKILFEFGHNKVNVIKGNIQILRGQIAAISGNYPGGPGNQPHVHINFWILEQGKGWSDPIKYIFNERIKVIYPNGDKVQSSDDIYRNLSDNKSISYWTVDNLPQFPLVG